MKTLLSSASLGTLVLISLLNGLKADTQTYAGSAAGSAAGSSVASSGFPQGPGLGGFPQFPFQFPSQSFSPFPYYGYNAFPYSFPYNQALFQPLPLFDFNTYNQQLQSWIKAAEVQAQQAAVDNKDNKDTTTSPFYGTAAAAQGFMGPQGGFGQTFVYPPPQDGQSVTYNRIAPPPPGSNRFGVSSFSSSSFSDNNGDKKGTRFSSVSVDDNGNVTTVVSSDPSNNAVAVAPARDASDGSNERNGWSV